MPHKKHGSDNECFDSSESVGQVPLLAGAAVEGFRSLTLTPDDRRVIRLQHRRGIPLADIAAAFRISQHQVSALVRSRRPAKG